MDLARASGKIQIDKLHEVHHIEFKDEINLVTEVDKACEQLIISEIQKLYPEHDILAEEGGGTRRHSDYKWIIDPLDGTTNYAHAYPLFCTSIALEHKGDIIVGAVYDPNRDEMFHAAKGEGSFLNGKRLQVSKNSKLIKSMLATGFAYNIKRTANNNLTNFHNMILSSQAVRRDGVAACDLCYVAAGRYDGFWELNLFPWDVAAGLLILQEAGGRVTDFSGKPFSIYTKEILSSNSLIHDEMISVLGLKEPMRI